MTLCLRTDNIEVEVALWHDEREVASQRWSAGRELSSQLLGVIDELLKQTGKTLSDLRGIVVYSGPGSYTGLRIGISTANALGYALSLPVVGSGGNEWLKSGQSQLASEKLFKPVLPNYGGEVFTTKPKK